MAALDKLNTTVHGLKWSVITVLAIMVIVAAYALNTVFELVKHNRVLLIAEVPAKCEAVIRDNSYFDDAYVDAMTRANDTIKQQGGK